MLRQRSNILLTKNVCGFSAWIQDVEKQNLPWLQMLDRSGVLAKRFAVTETIVDDLKLDHVYNTILPEKNWTYGRLGVANSASWL